MKTWGIIGLGWLGLELQNQLRARGDEVWGTRSSEFNFISDSFPDKKADLLFLNTPPIVSLPPTDYVNKIPAETKKVIFISSTSVYGENTGKIDERTPPRPKTDAAKWLVEIESKLRAKFGDRLTVIRPGGLIGGDRHPIKSLSRKVEIADGNQRIHLIHRDDLIQITILLSVLEGFPLINAVAPFHPTRRDYYGHWAEKLNLPKPTFKGGIAEDREIESLFVPSFLKTWKFEKLDALE
ncbi:epimerase [soil metagenome]